MTRSQDLTELTVRDVVIQELRNENLLLRELLCVWHGCPYGTQYHGDGELECAGIADGHRPIDFKRDTARDIERLMQEPSLRFIQLHQDDVCRHCGVTRWTWDASKPCKAVTHEWMTSRPEGTE